ncbi:MAG: class A beta-lactamase-related serine hydrolase [Muribaculaceae bacterium]|nr:class A beta-lactamase-related serine hydrolase [Muribaculaceae bacterium]
MGIAAAVSAFAAESLEDRIAAVVGDSDMGVAVISDWGDTISINGDKPFEMQSVMKFHQALAMAKTMSAVDLLNTKVTYGADDLKANTWSPLRAVNSKGGTVDLSTLLYYSLRMSDNNAADILFDRFLSPARVDSLLKADTPAKNFAIAHTEDDMHRNPSLASGNWSTPLDCAGLFNYAFAEDTTQSIVALQAVMASKSAFGNSRIVKGIGNGTVFNKTGTGFEKDGRTTAVNDAAFVYFPYASGGFGHYSIAVFSSDCVAEEAESKIAEISELVWTYHIMRANDLAANMINVAGASRPGTRVRETEGNGLGQILGAAALTAIVVDEIVNRVFDYSGSNYYENDNSSKSSGSSSNYSGGRSSKKSGSGARSTSQRRRPR